MSKWEDLLICWPPKTSLICKSPYSNCYLLSWRSLPLSLVSPCPSSTKDQLQILPGKFLRVQMNKIVSQFPYRWWTVSWKDGWENSHTIIYYINPILWIRLRLRDISQFNSYQILGRTISLAIHRSRTSGLLIPCLFSLPKVF